jgi:uncharacterized protein with NAD-binding domain and iron-sulfur cluster
MFLDYKGSLFWKMTAGMGDVVFAPLHQVLVRRGVHLRYFHNVGALIPDDTGSSIEAITFRRQAPADVVDSYEPLRRVRDIPCFPDRPALDSPCVDLATRPRWAGATPARQTATSAAGSSRSSPYRPGNGRRPPSTRS